MTLTPIGIKPTTDVAWMELIYCYMGVLPVIDSTINRVTLMYRWQDGTTHGLREFHDET